MPRRSDRVTWLETTKTHRRGAEATRHRTPRFIPRGGFRAVSVVSAVGVAPPLQVRSQVFVASQPPTEARGEGGIA